MDHRTTAFASAPIGQGSVESASPSDRARAEYDKIQRELACMAMTELEGWRAHYLLNRAAWLYRQLEECAVMELVCKHGFPTSLACGYCAERDDKIADAILSAAIGYCAENNALVSSLKEMIAVYWGDGDGQEPPPACIQRAQAALSSAQMVSLRVLTERFGKECA